MAARGNKLIGVRIDSGDLAAQAREVRKILDGAGLTDCKIIGSGGLDEYDLAELALAEAPFDSYGVGTKMGISADAPWTDISYKLVDYQGRPVLKLSTGKVSWPGKKQVFRFRGSKGELQRDVIGLRDEKLPGESLLQEVMRNGRLTKTYPSLTEIRKVFEADFASLQENVKAIRNPIDYSVEFSPGLRELREEITQKIGKS
jgi:nicotinate phosphoribosyltransferase